jgi:hypothetical protein
VPHPLRKCTMGQVSCLIRGQAGARCTVLSSRRFVACDMPPAPPIAPRARLALTHPRVMWAWCPRRAPAASHAGASPLVGVVAASQVDSPRPALERMTAPSAPPARPWGFAFDGWVRVARHIHRILRLRRLWHNLGQHLGGVQLRRLPPGDRGVRQ